MNRRDFIKRSTWVGFGLAALGPARQTRAAAANDRLAIAVMGVNGRGRALADSFAACAGARVAAVCDVDREAGAKAISSFEQRHGTRPASLDDFRRALDDPAIDALVIAAPDHWHTPATLLALDAGKHVYVEKPCSHNPREGELLVEAVTRSDRVVQMGNQQRSAPESIEILDEIRRGLIGRPYYARAWYANTRGSIGRGREAPVPARLDYELWQGPAPRQPYRDNVIHYNWHWFWHWGTGEICNNGTHEIDVCRWALDVGYPTRVGSAGGRYHFEDDWEAFDTQVATFEFAGGATLIWEGRSCNGRPVEGRGRGSSIHGEQGTVVLDRSGYVVYDLENREIRSRTRSSSDSALDTRGGGGLTDLHVANFVSAVQGREQLNAPIADARTSVLLCHLGNIAQRRGRSLDIDPTTGHIVGDEKAVELWGRDYEPGWEPKS